MVLNFQLMFNKRLFLTKRRRRSNRFLDLIPLVQSLNPVSGLSMSRRLSSIADKLIREKTDNRCYVVRVECAEHGANSAIYESTEKSL